MEEQPPPPQEEEEERAPLQDGGEESTSTSSASNAELPRATPAPTCQHNSRTFTGLRIFCRRR